MLLFLGFLFTKGCFKYTNSSDPHSEQACSRSQNSNRHLTQALMVLLLQMAQPEYKVVIRSSLAAALNENELILPSLGAASRWRRTKKEVFVLIYALLLTFGLER